MWGRVLRLGANGVGAVGRRSFLSAAYAQTERWASRKNAWALRNVKSHELYPLLDQQANRGDPISPVDLDVFVNSATDEQLQEVRDLLHKMRNTAQAHLSFPSSAYAAVRLYAESESYRELFDVLDDRLNYGVFLDRFSANALFDLFLRKEDFESAARVAGLLMLQEDFEGPIAESFALYSVYGFLKTPPPPPKPAEEVAETGTKPVKKKKVEEIKIRVSFLRNPFFDDHFDIVDPRVVAGKTMVALARRSKEPFADDCLFWGWLFYGKYDRAKAAAERLLEKGKMYEETAERLDRALENCDEKNAEALAALKEIKSIFEKVSIVGDSMGDQILNKLQQNIREHEKDEIEQHSATLDAWVRHRDERLRLQLERFEEMKKEKARAEREETLKELEQKLWYFDNKEAVELAIEKKNPKEFKNLKIHFVK